MYARQRTERLGLGAPTAAQRDPKLRISFVLERVLADAVVAVKCPALVYRHFE